jgi:hypothetical protein
VSGLIGASPLLRIAALYAIEAGIRGRAAEQRLAVRQAQSAPLVAELEAWLHAQLNRLSRGSKLAEAIRYGLRHWQGLSEFLSDGRLEMDTNTVEREIRPVAVTRTSDEVKALRQEARALKEVVAEQALELRLLKKSMIADGDDRA